MTTPAAGLSQSSAASAPKDNEPAHAMQTSSVYTRRRPNFQRRALDLFSGTGSVGRRLQDWGYEVVSVDNDPSTHATHIVNIMQWDYRKAYEPHYFDIIAAGVPCTEYSIAKTTAPRDFVTADGLVKRTLAIIQYFQPKAWWIENPASGYLSKRPFMQGIPFVKLDYCQFGEWGYQKPTCFWVSDNLAHLPSVTCVVERCPNAKPNGRGGYQHKERLGGNKMRYNSREKGQTPRKAIDYLLSGFLAEDPPPLHGCEFTQAPWVSQSTFYTSIPPQPALAQNPEYSNGVSAADVSVNKAEDARVNIAQTQEPDTICRLAPASEPTPSDMAQ